MNKTVLILFGVLIWGVLLLIIANQVYVDVMLTKSARQLERLQAQVVQLQAMRAMPPPQPPVTSTRILRPPLEMWTAPAVHGRAWGPEQAVGPPDTMQAGDYSTAWAPRMPDGGAEWLKVDFAKETQIAEVIVRETYNPGTVIKVTAVLRGGEETTIWEGDEPPAQAPVDRSFPVTRGKVVAKSVTIHLDTSKVAGWNEIDAVELIGTDGSRQWASQATASSSYADLR